MRGAVSRLRMSMTIHPMTLPHMDLSSRQAHADLLLAMEAEQRFKRTFFLINAYRRRFFLLNLSTGI